MTFLTNVMLSIEVFTIFAISYTLIILFQIKLSEKCFNWQLLILLYSQSWAGPAHLVAGCHWVLNASGWLHGLRHCFIHRRRRGKHTVLVRKSLCATRDPPLLGCIHWWLLVLQTPLHSAFMLRDALQSLQRASTMTWKSTYLKIFDNWGLIFKISIVSQLNAITERTWARNNMIKVLDLSI